VNIAAGSQNNVEGRMMWDLVRRVEGMGVSAETSEAPEKRTNESVGFAAKVIGIGVFAGLMLTYCNALIDACFRGLH
jgi:hypothetical protein